MSYIYFFDQAQKCREKYLNENLMKVNTDAECDDGDQGEEQGERGK